MRFRQLDGNSPGHTRNDNWRRVHTQEYKRSEVLGETDAIRLERKNFVTAPAFIPRDFILPPEVVTSVTATVIANTDVPAPVVITTVTAI